MKQSSLCYLLISLKDRSIAPPLLVVIHSSNYFFDNRVHASAVGRVEHISSRRARPAPAQRGADQLQGAGDLATSRRCSPHRARRTPRAHTQLDAACRRDTREYSSTRRYCWMSVLDSCIHSSTAERKENF